MINNFSIDDTIVEKLARKFNSYDLLDFTDENGKVDYEFIAEF